MDGPSATDDLSMVIGGWEVLFDQGDVGITEEYLYMVFFHLTTESKEGKMGFQVEPVGSVSHE